MRLATREAQIRRRFPPRPNLSADDLWAQCFDSIDKECVLECLQFFEQEFHINAGFLRPDDSLAALFAPVPTWNPLKWMLYRGIENDGVSELWAVLNRRLSAAGVKESHDIRTFGDYVHAWCGRVGP